MYDQCKDGRGRDTRIETNTSVSVGRRKNIVNLLYPLELKIRQEI